MTQLPRASGREVVAALSKVGYEKDRSGRARSSGHRSIAGLTVEEFKQLL